MVDPICSCGNLTKPLKKILIVPHIKKMKLKLGFILHFSVFFSSNIFFSVISCYFFLFFSFDFGLNYYQFMYS